MPKYVQVGSDRNTKQTTRKSRGHMTLYVVNVGGGHYAVKILLTNTVDQGSPTWCPWVSGSPRGTPKVSTGYVLKMELVHKRVRIRTVTVIPHTLLLCYCAF